MKILVLSDSHGNVGGILSAIDKIRPDALVFLGDGVSDIANIDFNGLIYAVKGNTDVKTKLKDVGKIRVVDKDILYVHGHEFELNKGLSRLLEYAKLQEADIVLYGHTHKPRYDEREGVVLINPGSISGKGDPATYAVLTIAPNGQVKCEHFTVA